MKKKYFKLFSGVVEELLEHPLISIQKFVINSGYPKYYLEDLEKRSGLVFGEGIIDFYSQLGEVQILWGVSEESAKSIDNNLNIQYYDLYGQIHIQDIHALLGMKGYAEHWSGRLLTEDLSEYDRKIMNKFKPFDYFDYDNSQFAGLMQVESVLTDNMGYYQTGNGFMDMKMDLPQYLEMILEKKGLNGCQIAQILKESEENKQFNKIYNFIFK